MVNFYLWIGCDALYVKSTLGIITKNVNAIDVFISQPGSRLETEFLIHLPAHTVQEGF